MHRLSRLPVATFLTAALLMGTARAQTDGGPLHVLPYSPSLDLSSMDRGAEACTDFYRYACGGWQAANPIPPDQASWSVYGKLAQDNLRFLWGLLQAASQPRADRSPAERRIGDYFAACMRPGAINAAGRRPLDATLTEIDRLRTPRDLGRTLSNLHFAGVDGAMFRFGSGQDYGDSSRVIAMMDAGGLGLPDRDYYLNDDSKSQQLREAYRAYVSHVFRLLGTPAPQADEQAAAVMEIETELARVSLTKVDKRDPTQLFHRMSLNQLLRMAPGFDWGGYLDEVSVPRSQPINVSEPAFFARLAVLANERPMADWRAYLRWHAARAYSPYLARPFASAHFGFYSRTLRGVEAEPPRWRKCVEWVDRDLGDALGQVFVAKTFTPETKAQAAEMTRRIERAMQQRIEALDWMSPRTREAAQAKLRSLVNKIGYPERWRSYAGLEISRRDFFSDVRRSLVFENRRQLNKIGRPLDRSEWGMTPPTVNAYYNPQMNDINFPAGVLQPPLFDPKMDDAPNYGNTGSTIGHELTHAFDDEGRQFDADGNLHDWWTKKDAAQFNERTKCIVDQYSDYPVVDELKINGRLTLGEDLADLGGTVLAYQAWREATANRPPEERDGFTPDQRFFIGMAQWACSNERPEVQRLRALTDPHSPSRWRVNGVVANMPEFAAAFSCKPGQAMVRPTPCKVW